MVSEKKQGMADEEVTFPHENDESGWEYYCFPKKESLSPDTVVLTDWNCLKPDLNELVYLDYVAASQWCHV